MLQVLVWQQWFSLTACVREVSKVMTVTAMSILTMTCPGGPRIMTGAADCFKTAHLQCFTVTSSHHSYSALAFTGLFTSMRLTLLLYHFTQQHLFIPASLLRRSGQVLFHCFEKKVQKHYKETRQDLHGEMLAPSKARDFWKTVHMSHGGGRLDSTNSNKTFQVLCSRNSPKLPVSQLLIFNFPFHPKCHSSQWSYCTTYSTYRAAVHEPIKVEQEIQIRSWWMRSQIKINKNLSTSTIFLSVWWL